MTHDSPLPQDARRRTGQPGADPIAYLKGSSGRIAVTKRARAAAAPTVLDCAGVRAPAAPAAMMGRSLLPILEEEDAKRWEVVYGSHQCHEVTLY